MRNTEDIDRGAWATLVKRMRAITTMSGAELARRLKVDRATIWRWETGKQRPENLELIEVFAELFALDVDEVLAAAGMRPAKVITHQELQRDPDYQELGRMLDDPLTSPETKQKIRTMLRTIRELIDAQQPQQQQRRPRRKSAG